MGARSAVPAAKVERRLSVRSTDLRRDGPQRARCAESGQSIRPPASLKRGFNIPGSGAPGDGANRRLRVYQVQPGQLFLGKYVPCRPKQFGMIERTNMKIRQSGQADRFASQR